MSSVRELFTQSNGHAWRVELGKIMNDKHFWEMERLAKARGWGSSLYCGKRRFNILNRTARQNLEIKDGTFCNLEPSTG